MLPCPNCSSVHVRTTDSRPKNIGDIPVRSRKCECTDCKEKFTTHEVMETEMELLRAAVARDAIIKAFGLFGNWLTKEQKQSVLEDLKDAN